MSGAAFVALSAGVPWQIGYGGWGNAISKAFGKAVHFGKSLVHGIAREVIGSLRGGLFKSGFLSGLVGSIIGRITNIGNGLIW